ncbi:MAG: TonB-dependent receptor [Rhodocyclales bacterium]|nr:TonB-dependent receptor [Rhodocyclales bacterium]
MSLLSFPRNLLVLAVAATFYPALARAEGETETVPELPVIEVVGISPVRGLEQPRNEIPASVQSLDRRALQEGGSATLPELLNGRLNGVTVNEIQGNTFQADVNYRGFTASPLLGTPQGLSVYQDGVRINEPFGDVVNWDLIPRMAISGIDLIPGSNPLFGLNTLGGALSIHTKSGLTQRGATLEAELGSFGRRSASADFSGKVGELGVYLAGTAFRDDGWRDFSPSKVDQFFGKLSHRNGPLEMDLAWTHADTDLTGNGLLPDSILQMRRESIFTKPDNTKNRLDLVSLNAGYWLDEKSRLSALVYHRRNRTQTLNGDVNDEFEGSANDGDIGANGGLGFDDETAANNRTRSLQRSWGGALQWSRQDDNNHVAFGVTADASRTSFSQTTEEGIFDAQRGVINGGGETLDNQLIGTTRTWSVFATDTYKPSQHLAITTSLRYNHTRVTTVDQLNPGVSPNLDGDFTYTKLNPSLGVTWQLSPAVTAFASMGQGNRTPSPIELACADPANPCSLPNAMQSDPFLKQVVTRTLEAGLRGQSGPWKWNAAAFTADNRDDILFVGTSTSQGYFSNVGRTRREGLQLDASARTGNIEWRAGYSYVKAAYRSAACLLSPNNSSSGTDPQCAADEIRIQSGNRLPGIPLHSLKLGAEYSLNDRWRLSADAVAFSRQYVRGNENNAHRAGGSFLGSGEVAAYGVLNLGARVRLDRGWEATVKVNNVFDRHYASAGALGANPFDTNGSFQTSSSAWTHETFTAPGAPRAVYFGLRLKI